MNDQTGAGPFAPVLLPARELIADRGYDIEPFGAMLDERGIAARIPPKKNRKQPSNNSTDRRRNLYLLPNFFGRLNSQCRVTSHKYRSSATFFGAITRHHRYLPYRETIREPST